ncbi:MAG: LysR family transcriptional regulator [Desulfobacteraceae bacterium]|nr:LysR family transcriptional regulator [Desulfobacteraceae bacterium]
MVTTIAKERNMTRAAGKLCLSQSALSQQLKDIETKLDTPLFFRTKKQMLLTPTGNKLMETAEQVIETLADTELEIAKMTSGETGELKVGTQCIFCYKWMPRIMMKFQNKFPNVEFTTGNSEDLAKELGSRKFDFVITGAPVADDVFTFQPLFEDEMACIIPLDHPLIVKSRIEFEDLANENVIIHSEKARKNYVELGFKPRGIIPKKHMIVSQPPAIIEMVAAGFGVSFAPNWAVRSAVETGRVAARPLTRTGLPIQWNAAYLKNRELTIFQKEFLNMAGRLNLDKI